MKKSTKTKARKPPVSSARSKTATTATTKNNKGLVSADIRKAYKSSLISAYFRRQS